MTNNLQTNVNNNISDKSPLNFFEEGQLTDWLSKNGKYIAYALIGLLTLFVILYRYSSSQAKQSEQDYLQASTDFVKFAKANPSVDIEISNTALQNLQAIMKKHPELHAAYDGMLAQILLNQGREAQAQPFAEATLNRTKIDDLPFYADFASTTLIIEKQDYKAALERAQALQLKMSDAISANPNSDQRSFGEELFAANLFRIAMLQQQLNDYSAELATWQLWKQYAGLDGTKKELSLKVNQQAFRTFIQQLAIGTISLPDYISYRESVLKKQK